MMTLLFFASTASPRISLSTPWPILKRAGALPLSLTLQTPTELPRDPAKISPLWAAASRPAPSTSPVLRRSCLTLPLGVMSKLIRTRVSSIYVVVTGSSAMAGGLSLI